MKKYKYILSILCILIIVMTVVLMLIVYHNGSRNMVAGQNGAREALRKLAEFVINRECERLEVPAYVLKKYKREYTKRRLFTENGMFVVTIDSLKESQGLYPLETVGSRFRMLQSYSVNLLDMMLTVWKEEIGKENPMMKCALKLTVTPLGKANRYESCLGDTTICLSQNLLGTYYVDDMYTTILTAYFIPSPFVRYIDWDSSELVLALGVWILLLGSLLSLILLNYVKNIANKSKSVFQIGEYSFDAIRQVLVCKGQEISCSSQSNKLLYAFVSAPDYFLSNNEIAHVCGWNLADDGLDSRRRTAISLVNKLFVRDTAIKIVSITEKNGYQLTVLS